MSRQDLIIFFILFLAAVLIIISNQTTPALWMRGFLTNMAVWPETFLSAARNFFSFWFDIIKNLRSIKIENQTLTKENLELKAQLFNVRNIEKENDLLKNQLNLGYKNNWKFIAANIIGRDYQNFRSFFVNNGRKSGIDRGMAVVGEGENVIGQVILATENTALIRTIFDPETKISAVAKNNKITGLVKGLGLDIVLDLMLKSKEIETQDLVTTSGQDGVWPRGLIIGKVLQVERHPNQILQTIRIQSLLDWPNLSTVFILKPS